MTQSLPLENRDLFWPPADELTEAAERIRARLGEWPPTHAPWRICLTAPCPRCSKSADRLFAKLCGNWKQKVL